MIASLIPCIGVADIETAVRFYESALGFTVTFKNVAETGEWVHADLESNGVKLMVAPAASFPFELLTPAQSGALSPISLHLEFADVDSAFATASANGAEVKSPPMTMPWGERLAHVLDPDGYSWLLWSVAEAKGA